MGAVGNLNRRLGGQGSSQPKARGVLRDERRQDNTTWLVSRGGTTLGVDVPCRIEQRFLFAARRSRIMKRCGSGLRCACWVCKHGLQHHGDAGGEHRRIGCLLCGRNAAENAKAHLWAPSGMGVRPVAAGGESTYLSEGGPQALRLWTRAAAHASVVHGVDVLQSVWP